MGDKYNKSGIWLPASGMKKCVDSRISRVTNSQYKPHENPADPSTACPSCIRERIPCVMAYVNNVPAILPLPMAERGGATPFDKGYYIKASE
jgi:hypothetical protein